jgi:hypothetical protein
MVGVVSPVASLSVAFVATGFACSSSWIMQRAGDPRQCAKLRSIFVKSLRYAPAGFDRDLRAVPNRSREKLGPTPRSPRPRALRSTRRSIVAGAV